MKELEKQSTKKVFDIQVADQIYTLRNPYGEIAEELQFTLAEQIYDSIRECDTDICDIASNLEQALAWKRLEAGTHSEDDVTWIKHECAERHHESKYNSGYSEAHDRAQSRYDGFPWDHNKY